MCLFRTNEYGEKEEEAIIKVMSRIINNQTWKAERKARPVGISRSSNISSLWWHMMEQCSTNRLCSALNITEAADLTYDGVVVAG